MNRNDVDWRGYWSAVPTPFTAGGEIDEAMFADLVEMYIGFGVHGLVIEGSSGEWFSQTTSERMRVTRLACEIVAKRVPVVVGICSLRPAESVELGKDAKAAGCDGVLATVPPCLKPDPDETVSFFNHLSREIGSPIVIYNLPTAVVTNISPELISKLADEVPNVVAVKNEVGMEQLLETISVAGDRVRIFDGFLMKHPTAIGVMETIGGDGYMAGGALLGREAPLFFESVWRKDYATAKRIAARERALASILYDARLTVQRYGRGYASRLKAVMNVAGQPAGFPRFPQLPVDDPASLQDIRERLTRIGIPVV